MWTKCNKVIDVLREIAAARDVQVSEVSLNWVLAQKGVTTTLTGPTKAAHVAENCRAADWELTEEQMGIIAEKLLHCAE